MAKVSLYIKTANPDKDGNCQIMLRVSNKGQPASFYTGFRVTPKLWDSEGQKIIKGAGASEINRNIHAMKDKLVKLTRDMDFEDSTKSYTVQDIRTRFEPMIRGESLKGSGLREMIERMTVERKDIKLRTFKAYRTLHTKHILDFEREVKHVFDVSEIDAEFFEDFKTFLWDNQNLFDDSVDKTLVSLKAALKWAKKKGYKVQDSALQYKGKQKGKEAIFLTSKEFSRMWNYDYSASLKPSVDMFLFSCVTGMRHSDVLNFHTADIRGEFISVTQIKTDDPALVPLNKYSRELIERYDGKIPKIGSGPVNKNLKLAAAVAGVDSEERRVRFKRGARVEKIAKKFEILGFHAGRSTFIMEHLKRGISDKAVMKMTGHKDYRSFQRYVRFTESLLLDIAKVVYG